MHVVFRAPATVFLFLFMFVAWIIAWLMQLVAMLIVQDKYRQQHVCAKIFRTANWIVFDLLNPLWSIKVLKPLPASITPTTKYIAMINHLSNSDPWVILRLFNFPFSSRDWRFVAKADLKKIPFGSWCMTAQGDLWVAFGKAKGGWETDKGNIEQVMRDAKDAVDNGGASIAVYPEGIRNANPNGDLNKFRAGFFNFAIENGFSILPVAVTGSEKAWPVHETFCDAANVYISAGELIDPKGHTVESLIDAVRGKIDEMRNSHPDRKEFLAKQQGSNKKE